MRRAWLLTFLAIPAVAAAQATPGTGAVTFDNTFVNSVECGGAGDISLAWSPSVISSDLTIPSNGEYHVYAANEASTSPTCKTASSGSVVAGEVLPVGGGTVTGTTHTYKASDFAARAGFSCSETSRKTIHVCVQGTAANGAAPNFGFAIGTLTLDTLKPPKPVISGPPLPGDGALYVSWSPGNATSDVGDSHEYVLEAREVGSTASSTPISSPRTTDTGSYRFGGLTNFVTYEVVVRAYSEADNVSDPSDAVTGEPLPSKGFWDLYSERGGREQGGCSGGPAGLASLAVAAGVALLLRRRK